MNASVEKLLEQDDFTVWIPGVEILEKAGEDVEQTRPIGGWCSTEALDRQDEVVVAKGLDFSEFVLFGWFNDNHKQDTSAVLGYPRLAKLEKGRWWTEGNLIAGYHKSDEIWELAKALKKSRAPRQLGFSIEGKVLLRDNGNRIVKAKVRNVAITSCQVNTECTWTVLSKAFASAEKIERAAKKTPTAIERAMTFEGAVDRIQRIRPHYSRSTCERVVRFAMAR
jgi:hypothetical protein